MKYVVTDQIVLRGPPNGPLAAYVSTFANLMLANGYRRQTTWHHVRVVADFSHWLQERSVELHRVRSRHALQYLQERPRAARPADCAVLRHLMDFLRRCDVVQGEAAAVCDLTPSEAYVQAYQQYLREMRGLADPTIVYYAEFARVFLQHCFGNRDVNLSRLGAGDVVGFVQLQAQRLRLKRAKLMTTAVRSLLRYARFRGDIDADLASAVPVVANWSMPSIPRAIGPDQIRRLLSGIDRRTETGLREYAILLMFARLGLRASEVAFLELGDIDWRAGHLTVRRKGGQRNVLPLHADVGEAIAAYLQHGRPHSACRRVFLTTKAPIAGLRGPSSVDGIVEHALERAGIDAPTRGAHQFRHGLAADMLRHGASLGEIGEVLGHRNPQTTMTYAKVDVDALRTLAVPWPGGVE
jgi:site-specific recombinase XerD